MSKRGRNLAALAALGALGYEYINRGDKQKGKDVPVETRVNPFSATPAAAAAAAPTSDASVDPLEAANARAPIEVPAGPRVSSAPTSSPARVSSAATSSTTRSMAPAKQKLLKTDEDFPPVRMPAKSTASTSPGTMGAYVSRAGTRATEPAASPARSGPEQIPRSGVRTVASDTDPSLRVESDSDAQRNISNVFNALPQGRAAKAAKTIVSAPIRRLAGPAAEAPSAMRSLPAPRPSGPKGDASQTVRGGRTRFNEDEVGMEFKRGGKTKKMASGGSTSSSEASRRADGIAQRGKTKGRLY